MSRSCGENWNPIRPRLVISLQYGKLVTASTVESVPPNSSSEPVTVILYHLRHAFRRLRREPGFTAAAVLTLALGVGANVAVFPVVEAVLPRPLPYDHAEELVVVRHRDTRTGITKVFIAGG